MKTKSTLRRTHHGVRAWPTWLVAVAGATLAGCTVGPNFRAPPAPTQSRYLASGTLEGTHRVAGAKTGAAQHFIPGARLQRDWYRLYHSAALDRLIGQALAGSPTVQAARHRVAAAREAVNIVYGGRYPSVSLGGGVSRTRATGAILGLNNPLFSSTFNLYQAQIAAAYDLDVFGELTRRIENKQAWQAVAHDQLLDAQATLVNNIVVTALAEAGARTTRTALQAVVAEQRKTVQLVKQQEHFGTALRSDVLRAETQLADTESLIPDYSQQIAVARHRMAILTGVAPVDYHGPKFTLADFTLPSELPLTLPARLVAQRPDILAARNTLHAASAAIGIATAEELPKIQLTASLGDAALKTNAFTGPLAEQFNVGAGLLAPLFEGGKLRAQKREAVDDYQAAAADYRATVLKAFDQVADALRALDNDTTRLDARNRGRQAAEANAQVTQAQFHAGSADLLSAYLAQVQLTQAEIHYATARLARLVDTATLMRALGGGWWPQGAAAPSTATPRDAAASPDPNTSNRISHS
ncbi:MAG TPA: efflux transporter outer membrane subunit [Nevskiaceae bacterium]|nr:efflux transporter outer membrane subunit [Nevskiaceae bacterium]